MEDVLRRLSESGKECIEDYLFAKSNREELNEMLSLVGRMSPEDIESSTFLTKLKDVAASQEVLKKRRDREWHRSICYPLPRGQCHFGTDLLTLYCELRWPVLSGRGGCLLDKAASSNAIPDVVSSLSLGGTLVGQTAEQDVVLEPDTFAGKYVLVFCMNAPVLYQSDGCQSLLNLCKDLYSYSESHKIKMVMVMVARMNLLADEKGVFEHLFSGFPHGSLAVPYDDWERRERIWKLLNGSSYGIRCSVYKPDGNFLTCFRAGDGPYGAEAFPFDGQMLAKTEEERKRLRKEGSLEELLRPYESSKEVFVHELNTSEEKKRISEVIKNKHVGLYVCCEYGSPLVPLVQKLYDQQCKIKGKEFEIVVLFLPFLCQLDPEVFQEEIVSSLQKQKIREWWCLPFNNSVSLRFWGLTKDCDCGYYNEEWCKDKLIIVGPDGKILDMYGAPVIYRSDGFDAFPFTRQAVVDKKKLQVKGLTLDSRRLEGGLVRGNDWSDAISTDELELFLKEKRIVICLGMPRYYDFQGLVSRYKKEADRSKFEVVYIQFPGAQVEQVRGGQGQGQRDVPFAERGWYTTAEMPWYIHCPLNASLAQELKELFRVKSLIGFGEDGRVCSVKDLAELAEVGQDYDFCSLKQLDEAGMGALWTWEHCCLDDTLDDDIHHLFNFHRYAKI